MPRLVWSPAALRDVQRLYRFLADKNPTAATRAARVIREGVKIIAGHRARGRPVVDMDPASREWITGFGDSARSDVPGDTVRPDFIGMWRGLPSQL